MLPEPASRARRRPRIGKYQVVTHVATGGMGAVYKAIDVEAAREVALKVLSPDFGDQPILFERFRREASLAKLVNHENIVKLYECGDFNGIQYMALEFVDGIDLHTYVFHRDGKLGIVESRDIMVQAVRAMDHLHGLGIIHRDIKPSNFLLTVKDGRKVLKLIDLGLARAAQDEDFRLTRTGTTLGTVDFISPEQAIDCGTADIRSDIYSLGCTWFFLLTGQPPFPDGTLPEKIHQHIRVEPPDIREINPEVPERALKIMARMLAKDPADRYQVPADVLADLLPNSDPELTLKRKRTTRRSVKTPVLQSKPVTPPPVPKQAANANGAPEVTAFPKPVSDDELNLPARDREWWLWVITGVLLFVALLVLVLRMTVHFVSEPKREPVEIRQPGE